MRARSVNGSDNITLREHYASRLLIASRERVRLSLVIIKSECRAHHRRPTGSVASRSYASLFPPLVSLVPSVCPYGRNQFARCRIDPAAKLRATVINEGVPREREPIKRAIRSALRSIRARVVAVIAGRSQSRNLWPRDGRRKTPEC